MELFHPKICPVCFYLHPESMHTEFNYHGLFVECVLKELVRVRAKNKNKRIVTSIVTS